MAGLAAELQVSAAVGAFLVGIALSGPLVQTAQQVLSPLRDLFAAVFFVFFGLQTNPADLPPVVGIALFLAMVGVVTKLLTGWLSARRKGIGHVGGLRAGAALVPRGEFNIVIAGLAVAAGLHPRLGPLAAAYVLILAVVPRQGSAAGFVERDELPGGGDPGPPAKLRDAPVGGTQG